MGETEHVVGLISDTHGLLRPGVSDALAGVELILHSGDVGEDEILDELESIAPLLAVRGNTDAPGNPRLPEERLLSVGIVRVHVSHGHEVGGPTPEKLLARYDADVLMYGHTHRPLVVEVGGRWVVNPGAAGPRRFDIMPSVARMSVIGRTVRIEVVDLEEL